MRKLFKVSLVSIFLVVCAFATALPEASAALIFDRGLPTVNLNNTAGANRSNVAWAFGSVTDGYWVAGDDFSISGSGTYHVDTITVWAKEYSQSINDTSLWFGKEGGILSNIAPATISTATYAGGIGYQGNSGTITTFYKLDFTLNQNITAGTTYQFFLDNAFILSSNAALSGSPQAGADDYMLALFVNGVDLSVESWQSLGNGWDKNSDANIQVYGSAVPIPGAVWLLGSGLVGLVALKRKFRP